MSSLDAWTVFLNWNLHLYLSPFVYRSAGPLVQIAIHAIVQLVNETSLEIDVEDTSMDYEGYEATANTAIKFVEKLKRSNRVACGHIATSQLEHFLSGFSLPFSAKKYSN